MDNSHKFSLKSKPINLKFRNAGPDDEGFFFHLFATHYDRETDIPGWDERIKSLFLKTKYRALQISEMLEHPNACRSVILVNGNPAGGVLLASDNEEILLVDFFLLPDYRRAPVAEALAEQLQSRAMEERKALCLRTEGPSEEAELLVRAGFHRPEGITASEEIRWNPPARETEGGLTASSSDFAVGA